MTEYFARIYPGEAKRNSERRAQFSPVSPDRQLVEASARQIINNDRERFRGGQIAFYEYLKGQWLELERHSIEAWLLQHAAPPVACL